MVRFDQLEDEIVARLSPIVTSVVEVFTLPENQSFKPPNGNGVHVYISANQFESDEVKSTSHALQNDKIVISVFLLSKNCRSTESAIGIYEVCNGIRMLLAGWKPSSCEQILTVSGGFTEPSEKAENIWHYMMRFRTITPAMNEPSETQIAEAITQITHYNELGDTTVTPNESNSVVIYQYGLDPVYIIPPNPFTVDPSKIVDSEGNILLLLSPGQSYEEGSGSFQPVLLLDEDGETLATLNSGDTFELENYNIEVFLDGVSQGVTVLPPLTDGNINVIWI